MIITELEVILSVWLYHNVISPKGTTYKCANVIVDNFPAWKKNQWTLQRLRDEYNSIDSATRGSILGVIIGIKHHVASFVVFDLSKAC